MIKFFRKLRLKLISSQQLKNYTVYAFGEILLVVIGILIALQINNWNEYRQRRQKEKTLLIEMAHSLETDSASIDQYILRMNASTSASKKLATFPEYHDSLTIDFISSIASVILVPKTSPFEQLKSFGMDIILNDSLRQMVINYYDVNLKNTQERLHQNLGKFNAEVMLPFYYENFKMTASDTSYSDLKYVPKSYDDLINNPDYYSILVFKYIYNEQEKLGLLELQREIGSLISAIRNELSLWPE